MVATGLPTAMALSPMSSPTRAPFVYRTCSGYRTVAWCRNMQPIARLRVGVQLRRYQRA